MPLARGIYSRSRKGRDRVTVIVLADTRRSHVLVSVGAGTTGTTIPAHARVCQRRETLLRARQGNDLHPYRCCVRK